MYSCYLLSEQSRQALLKAYPPKYPEVICHHITVKFGVPDNAPLPEEPKSVEVIGYIDDGRGLEAFLVSVDGKTERPDGKIYHITHSLDAVLGYKPKDSNELIKKTDDIVKIKPININVTPKII